MRENLKVGWTGGDTGPCYSVVVAAALTIADLLGSSNDELDVEIADVIRSAAGESIQTARRQLTEAAAGNAPPFISEREMRHSMEADPGMHRAVFTFTEYRSGAHERFWRACKILSDRYRWAHQSDDLVSALCLRGVLRCHHLPELDAPYVGEMLLPLVTAIEKSLGTLTGDDMVSTLELRKMTVGQNNAYGSWVRINMFTFSQLFEHCLCH